MKSAGKARNNGLYRHIRTSKEIIRNLLNDSVKNKNFRAIPHKERTAKRTKKGYNKEVKKQLTMSLISDELGAGINEEKQRVRKLIPSKRATNGTSATRSTSAWMRTADWFTRWKRQPLSYIEIGSKAHTRFHQKYGYKNFINIRTVMDEF